MFNHWDPDRGAGIETRAEWGLPGLCSHISWYFLLITACAFPSALTTAGHEEFLQSVDPDNKSQRELLKAEIGKRVSRQRGAGRALLAPDWVCTHISYIHFIEEETESWRDYFPKVSWWMVPRQRFIRVIWLKSMFSQYMPCCSTFLNSGCFMCFLFVCFFLFNMKTLKTQCQKALTEKCFAIQWIFQNLLIGKTKRRDTSPWVPKIEFAKRAPQPVESYQENERPYSCHSS